MFNPPKPDRDLTNLGAILDQPFLFQARNPFMVKVPSSQSFVTQSTLLPSGTATGVAVYSYDPANMLAREVQTTGPATKTTEYLYSPADPAEIITALKARRSAQQAELAELKAQSPSDKSALKACKQRLKTTEEKLAKAKKAGASPPAKLARTKWTEESEGEVTVSGETVFHYDGPDIARSTSTIKTHEEPPRIDQLETEYRYNALGQVHEIETAGSVTECEYDPMGRLASKSGHFLSPAGDFLADHRTEFTYSPAAGDPKQIPPPNALLSSVNDSISGPLPGFQESPDPLEAMPPSAPAAGLASGIAEPPPLPQPPISGKLDTTRVTSTYVYP